MNQSPKAAHHGSAEASVDSFVSALNVWNHVDVAGTTAASREKLRERGAEHKLSVRFSAETAGQMWIC